MGSSLLYISIAYYMQKGGGWVQIACKIAYVLNERPLIIEPDGDSVHLGNRSCSGHPKCDLKPG